MNISKPIYQSLSKHLPWNKARLKCMVALIQGMLGVRSVNLSTMSSMFQGGDALGRTPGPKARGARSIWGMNLCFAHKKITGNRGSDLFVVSNGFKGEEALELYHQRWGIELLFSHLKRRGFNLEATHLTKKKKLETLMAVVSLSFLYSYGWGLHLRATKKQTAFVRRKSDFKYGLDSIIGMLFNPISTDGLMPEFLDWIDSGVIQIDC